MSDNIYNPEHYTVYPVQPIEITRHLGFCLGNATKYVLRAPYKGGVEDCDKALCYLELERETPQPSLPVNLYNPCTLAIKKLVKFFYTAEGDDLWKDIAQQSAGFTENLFFYLTAPDNSVYDNMRFSVLELKRILALRGPGDIYAGMSGLPEKGSCDVR